MSVAWGVVLSAIPGGWNGWMWRVEEEVNIRQQDEAWWLSYCGGNWLQRLLKEKCMSDEKLFGSFLNRLFNTLNWTITEFSVAIKEMQEHLDLRQVGVFE